MSHLLIVDDDHGFCDLVANYLSEYFENIDSVFSVPEAIGKIKSGQYHFIILDLNLGSGSGLSVLRYARREDCLNFKTPVLVVSGELGVDLSAFNFTNFLAKPFKEDELLAKIKELKAAPKGPKKTPSTKEDSQPPATHPELLKLLKKS